MDVRLTAEQQALVTKNEPLAVWAVKHLWKPLRLYRLGWEDAVQEAFIGLCRAAAAFDPDRKIKFDPDRKIKFATFAARCMRNAILHALYGNYLVHIPSHLLTKKNQQHRYAAAARQAAKVARIGMHKEKIERTHEETGNAAVEQEEQLDVRHEIMQRLREQLLYTQWTAIRRHYGDDATYRKVGGELGVSYESARLYAVSGLNKARKFLKEIGVEPLDLM